MTNERKEIILLTRADDMGYTHTGNLAILDCLRCGIIRSAAILVVAPWFEEAVQIARENPDLCFGVHLGRTSFLGCAPLFTHHASNLGTKRQEPLSFC